MLSFRIKTNEKHYFLEMIVEESIRSEGVLPESTVKAFFGTGAGFVAQLSILARR
jgi:hypothetical protein